MQFLNFPLKFRERPPPPTTLLLQQYFTPTKIKISDPIGKHFSEIFSPYPQAGGGAYHGTNCIFDRSYKSFHTELKFKLYSYLVWLTLRKLCFISNIKKTFFSDLKPPIFYLTLQTG